MNTYPPQDLARAKRFGEVTSNGVAYIEDLAGSRGMHFTLLREPHHSTDDIRIAQRWLRDRRDVVSMSIAKPAKE